MSQPISSNNKMALSRIIGVQFSMLSPEEIRKNSVVEISSRDTYINNKPVLGGLFDPRMGVSEPGIICPTDGYTYILLDILDILSWRDQCFMFNI